MKLGYLLCFVAYIFSLPSSNRFSLHAPLPPLWADYEVSQVLCVWCSFFCIFLKLFSVQFVTEVEYRMEDCIFRICRFHNHFNSCYCTGSAFR